MTATAPTALKLRPLAPEDLGRVVEIDATIEGRSRQHYVERRLQAALRDPKLHAQFAAVDDHGLAGYILARVYEDEFGRGGRSLRLELVGVRPDVRGLGVGRRLYDTLAQWAQRHEVPELRTLARWNDIAMLRWLDSLGFRLAADYVVECAVSGGAYLPERDDALDLPVGEGPAHEINFGHDTANDYERLTRDTADVRTMSASDLADIVRIDRGIIGRDRSAYLRARLDEALDDAGLRVSLVARRDGINVGYLMARLDRGDFGRIAPVAVIDTLGVDPDSARLGIGRAMLSQLFANLGSLQVERVETLVAARDVGLLGFLFGVGFEPAQRLAFQRGLA